MKRSLVLFIVVLVCAVVPGTAAAYLLSAELLAFIASVPPTNDFAVGEGKFQKGQPAEQFNIAAHGSLLSAKGHVRFNSATIGEARGTVDCLFVDGNHAGVAGRFDEPLGGQFPYFIVALEDNGEPRGAPLDRAALAGQLADTGAVDCGLAEILTGGTLPLVQGNIVVKDR